MRIDIHAINLTLSQELRDYAETRMWQAARRAARRVAWLGLWLVEEHNGDEKARFTCRLDAWVRGVGIVTARHRDSDARTAVDIASVWLGQAIAGRPTELRKGSLSSDGRMNRRALRQAHTPRAVARCDEEEALPCG